MTTAVLVRSHSSTQPGGVRAISAPRAAEFTRLRGENRLQASFAIEYELVPTPDPDRGPWKVSTRKYMYHVVRDDMTEVILFHWHPDGKSSQQLPHLHIGSSQLTPDAVVSHRTHVPSGRVSLESVVELLIREFKVVPLRSDWQDVLDEGRQRFLEWRTWS